MSELVRTMTLSFHFPPLSLLIETRTFHGCWLACPDTLPFDCHRKETILRLRIMILSYQRISVESNAKPVRW